MMIAVDNLTLTGQEVETLRNALYIRYLHLRELVRDTPGNNLREIYMKRCQEYKALYDKLLGDQSAVPTHIDPTEETTVVGKIMKP